MLFLVGYSHRTTRKTINSDPVPPSTRLAMQRIRKKVYTPSACSMDSQEKKKKSIGFNMENLFDKSALEYGVPKFSRILYC